MKKIIVGNWKSNKDVKAVENWFSVFVEEVKDVDWQQVEVALAPPFPLLMMVQAAIDHSGLPLKLAVQDLSPFPAGAYTGAVSVANLRELNVKYAIVGHSERRRYFHEEHGEVGRKVGLALDAKIIPVVCVDKDYVAKQAVAINGELLSKCVVAYEPLSAIGTGNNEDVGTVKRYIKEIKVVFGDVPVIYGGSVKADNVGEYLLVSDGALPGGASLDPKKFADLINKAVIKP